MALEFDFNVRLGDLLVLGSFLGGGVGFIFAMKGEIKLMAKDVASIESKVEAQGIKIESLAQIITTQALQDQRLVMMEKTIEELRRGEGWIRGPRRVGLEGAYDP